MNEIFVEYNLDNKNLEINQKNLDRDEIKIYFAVRDVEFPYNIKGLSFGYEIKNETSIIDYNQFPEPGTKYVSTDQKIIFSHVLPVDNDKKYKVIFWVRQHSKIQQKEIEVEL